MLTDRCWCVLQGKYQELASSSIQQLVTNGTGQFTIAKPALANYRFSSSYASSICQDSVTGTRLTFPWSLAMPARSQATITAISLLTVPASSDAQVQVEHASATTNNDDIVPGYLWNHVYGMFGYNATQMGVRTWSANVQADVCCHSLSIPV